MTFLHFTHHQFPFSKTNSNSHIFTARFENDNKNNNNIESTNTHESVVNLSSHILTSAQRSLLEKGLNFCPSPGNRCFAETRSDLDRFHQSLKLWCYFSHENSPEDSAQNLQSLFDSNTIVTSPQEQPFSDPKFKKKSTWTSQGPVSLEAMISHNEQDLLKIKPSYCKDNLSQAERIA